MKLIMITIIVYNAKAFLTEIVIFLNLRKRYTDIVGGTIVRISLKIISATTNVPVSFN